MVYRNLTDTETRYNRGVILGPFTLSKLDFVTTKGPSTFSTYHLVSTREFRRRDYTVYSVRVYKVDSLVQSTGSTIVTQSLNTTLILCKMVVFQGRQVCREQFSRRE